MDENASLSAKNCLASASERRSLHGDDGTFPSDFECMGLSPIAKSRGSDASIHNIKEAQETEEPRDRYGNPSKESQQAKGLVVHQSTQMLTQNTQQQQAGCLPDASSLQNDDLQSVRKQVGESSSNFIDKIRNAAHKRKVAVTRSRDSLVAKEQEQLRSIAESKALQETKRSADENYLKENVNPRGRPSSSVNNTLKKRNSLGFGGFGVPKVEKRPNTTPLSPLLGSRRRERISVKALEEAKMPSYRQNSGKTGSVIVGSSTKPNKSIEAEQSLKRGEDKSVSRSVRKPRLTKHSTENRSEAASSFRARPVPPFSGVRGHAGQIGVPKVSKRPVTVPVSPRLGPKRRPTMMAQDGESQRMLGSRITNMATRVLRRSAGSSGSSDARSSAGVSTGENSGLLGLEILDSTPTQTVHDSNHNEILTPRDAAVRPFEPRSTSRANRRAEFDAVREKNRQLQLQREREQLQQQIKEMQKELLIFSRNLR